ncbi:hypothetical protein [Actinomadura sp. NPDC000929]|uniref:hypothetical protein n=1 Tax=unclassified Actinomadura TaxID=2626254 RepID=UPI0033988A89
MLKQENGVPAGDEHDLGSVQNAPDVVTRGPFEIGALEAGHDAGTRGRGLPIVQAVVAALP